MQHTHEFVEWLMSQNIQQQILSSAHDSCVCVRGPKILRQSLPKNYHSTHPFGIFSPSLFISDKRVFLHFQSP